MPIKISAVIITKNEETNIARCLTSLQGVVDEAIVMDSFSTDRTRHIVETFVFAKFQQMAWLGYSMTKNEANRMASGDFILSIDADEALSTQLREEILNVKHKIFPGESIAYWVNRKTNFEGSWIHFSGLSPDWQMRFFPKPKARWNGAATSEKIILDDTVVTSRFNGLLLHYPYPTLSSFREKIEKRSRWQAELLTGQGSWRAVLFLKCLIFPLLHFLKIYFVHLGIFDGRKGFLLAFYGAYGEALKYGRAAVADRSLEEG